MEIDLPILIFSNPTKLAIQKPPSLMRDDYSTKTNTQYIYSFYDIQAPCQHTI